MGLGTRFYVGIQIGLTKSAEHPSTVHSALLHVVGALNFLLPSGRERNVLHPYPGVVHNI